MKQRLFTETALKSQKAMDIASGMETAGENMEAAHGTTSKLGEAAIQVAKKLRVHFFCLFCSSGIEVSE